MRRWSLRVRFLLLLIGLLVAVFAAITLVIVRHNTVTLKTNLIDQSKSFASLATQPIGSAFVLYKDSGTIHIQQQVQHFTELDGNINQVEVVDFTGKQLFIKDPTHPIKVSAAAAISFNTSYLYDHSGNLTAIVQPYLDDFGIHRYALAYGISYQSVNRTIRGIVTSIIILSSVILLISLAVWYVLINQLFLRPVARLSQIALLISKGDLNRQLQVGRNDEIGDLAGAVNTMANSLKADIAKLKRVDELKNEFMMITSHNLRTPLSIMKGYLDLIKSMNPPPELQRMFELIKVNATRLSGFAEDVLTISTIEAGKNILQPEPTEMKPVLDAIVEEFAMMAEQKELHFETTIDTTAWVNLSRPHFRSALWNLLDNAYKFTDEKGSITLTARTVGDQLEITVKDTGIGIAAAEVPRLFTKFHRATSIMAYNYEGTGIGLYITKLIVEQHGGHITVETAEGKGSTFTVQLPTIKPPAAPQPPAQAPPAPPAEPAASH